MIIYENEKKCGLEEIIKTQSSIAYFSPIYAKEISDLEDFPLEKIVTLSVGGIQDPDLYHVYSVLVSTNWNKNDDIFDQAEVWAAKRTPIHKPTNLEHDEKQSVGSIIDSWAVNRDYDLIPDDTSLEDLPELYHLIVSSVIYRQWQDPELQARAETLISEIEAGSKYVSMECIFRGFDYGVIDPDGNNHIIARSAETSFLTQFLRAYGGTGKYDGHKIGRLLRNITFSGKGFVDRPANSDSIIFNKDKKFSFANAKNTKNVILQKNGVISDDKQFSSENNNNKDLENIMSVELLNDQIKELKEALANLKLENKELLTKLTEASSANYESKVKELEAQVSDLTKSKEDLNTILEASNDRNIKLIEELEAANEALTKAMSEKEKMAEEKKKKDRKDKMSDAGLSNDEVEAKYESVASMSDEHFEMFIDTIKSFRKTTDETSTEETSASEVVTTETEEGTHSVSSEEEETEENLAKAGIRAWAEQLIKKNK